MNQMRLNITPSETQSLKWKFDPYSVVSKAKTSFCLAPKENLPDTKEHSQEPTPWHPAFTPWHPENLPGTNETHPGNQEIHPCTK